MRYQVYVQIKAVYSLFIEHHLPHVAPRAKARDILKRDMACTISHVLHNSLSPYKYIYSLFPHALSLPVHMHHNSFLLLTSSHIAIAVLSLIDPNIWLITSWYMMLL